MVDPTVTSHHGIAPRVEEGATSTSPSTVAN